LFCFVLLVLFCSLFCLTYNCVVFLCLLCFALFALLCFVCFALCFGVLFLICLFSFVLFWLFDLIHLFDFTCLFFWFGCFAALFFWLFIWCSFDLFCICFTSQYFWFVLCLFYFAIFVYFIDFGCCHISQKKSVRHSLHFWRWSSKKCFLLFSWWNRQKKKAIWGDRKIPFENAPLLVLGTSKKSMTSKKKVQTTKKSWGPKTLKLFLSFGQDRDQSSLPLREFRVFACYGNFEHNFRIYTIFVDASNFLNKQVKFNMNLLCTNVGFPFKRRNSQETNVVLQKKQIRNSKGRVLECKVCLFEVVVFSYKCTNSTH